MGKAQSKISEEVLSGLEKDKHFSRGEIQKRYKDFHKRYPSGQLDRDDFSKIYKAYFPYGEPSGFAGRVFDVFDEDHNGFINFREFTHAVGVIHHGQPDEKRKWAFSLYDIDRSGAITRKEMLLIVESIDRMTRLVDLPPLDEETPEQRVDKIFSEMDLDKDAKVTLSEFVEGWEMIPSEAAWEGSDTETGVGRVKEQRSGDFRKAGTEPNADASSMAPSSRPRDQGRDPVKVRRPRKHALDRMS